MTLIYVLLVAHFLADFVCQSDWMALNKSKSWRALAWHVLAYTAVLYGCLYVTHWYNFWWNLNYGYEGLWFIGVNAAAHFVQDAITSRVNARLWQANERHWFFVGIGFDQLLHYLTLFVTADWWLR